MRERWIMAVVNVADWTPAHVAEWLRGLDDVLLPYVHFFLNNAVDGPNLLKIAVDDLPNLNVTKLGHQELILEAVELLRNFHYGLDTENVQSLALCLSCKSRSLFNELRSVASDVNADGKQEQVSTPTLSAVADILLSVKALVSWLDRTPFEGLQPYLDIRNQLLHISIELATNAQRDTFAERPVHVIKTCCAQIFEICDHIVKEYQDPFIIQPAYLDFATIKKRQDEELGMNIRSSYSGIHHIGQVKYKSPAHICGKIEDGDEVIQVNYQTVVGWQLKKLVSIMRDHATEVVLTLKKRPRHTALFGQVLPRTFFFPAKKQNPYPKHIEWQRDIPPSPQFGNLSPATAVSQSSPKDLPEDDDDSAFLPEGSETNSPTIDRLFVPRHRQGVQRRATVTGVSPTDSRPPVSIAELLQAAKKEQVMRSVSHDSSNLLSPFLKREDPNYSPLALSSELQGSCTGKFLRNMPQLPVRPATCIGTMNSSECDISSALLQNLPNKSIELKKLEQDPAISNNNSNHININQLSNRAFKDLSDVTNTTLSTTDSYNGSEIANTQTNSLSKKEDLGIGIPDNFNSQSQENSENKSTKDISDFTEEKKAKLKESTSIPINNQNEASLNRDIHQSYQVIIAGGVPQKSLSLSRDSSKSPVQSPVLRKKGRPWEFGSRRVSCKDLGMGDCQGWLYKRKLDKGILVGSKWVKYWCILKNLNFFCYKDKEDLKAECLLYLPGFSVSPAPEIKSKKHVFRVYHTGTTFYFASDSQQDMSKWMNKMGLAAISYSVEQNSTISGFTVPDHNLGVENVYFSETEDDGEEAEMGKSLMEDSSPLLQRIKKVESSDSSPEPSHGKSSASSSSPEYLQGYAENSGSSSSLASISTDSKQETGLSAISSVELRSSNTMPKCMSDINQQTQDFTSLSDLNIMTSSETSSTQSEESIYQHTKTLSLPTNHAVYKSSLVQTDERPTFSTSKIFFHDQKPVSKNISSISLQSIKKPISTRRGSTPVVLLNKSGISSATHKRKESLPEMNFCTVGVNTTPIISKSLHSVTLTPAFEMNLDHSPPRDLNGQRTKSQETVTDQSRRFSKSMARLLGSPKILKKLTPSSKSGAKRNSTSVEMAFSSKTDRLQHLERVNGQNVRGVSYVQTETLSSPWKEDKGHSFPWYRKNHPEKSATWDFNVSRSGANWSRSKSTQIQTSSNRDLYLGDVQCRTKVCAEQQEFSPGKRTSLKPAMGVSMIGKQRRSSVLSDRQAEPSSPVCSLSSSSVILNTKGTQTDEEDDDDEFTCMAENLYKSDLTIDGTNVHVRRKNVMLSPYADKRRSQQLLEIRALQRTLKAKELELHEIEDFLSTTISSETLQKWMHDHSYMFQSSESLSEAFDSD